MVEGSHSCGGCGRTSCVACSQSDGSETFLRPRCLHSKSLCLEEPTHAARRYRRCHRCCRCQVAGRRRGESGAGAISFTLQRTFSCRRAPNPLGVPFGSARSAASRSPPRLALSLGAHAIASFQKPPDPPWTGQSHRKPLAAARGASCRRPLPPPAAAARRHRQALEAPCRLQLRTCSCSMSCPLSA